MRHCVWILVLLAGCAKGPYPRLAGGERAILFRPDVQFMRVEIVPFDPFGTKKDVAFEIFEVGTPVLILADDSEKSGEDRPVRARVTGGEHRGLDIKAERHYLKAE